MGDLSSWVTLSMKFDCRRLQIDRLDGKNQVEDHAGQEHGDEGGADRKQHPIEGRVGSAFQGAEHIEEHPADGQHDQEDDHDDRQNDGQAEGAAERHALEHSKADRGRQAA